MAGAAGPAASATAGTSAAIAVVAAAIFGAAAGCKVFLVPDRPDIAATAQRVGNQADQVGAFAADFVTTWLTATTAQRPALQRFITLPEGAPALPTTPAAVVTTPQVVSVIRTGALGEGELYAVTISVNERPYASAAPVRAFYRVPVLMWDYQPRALMMPARVNGPGPGADAAIGYRQALGADSPVFAVVAGFIRTYLTATTGLDRYVLATSALHAVGGYQNAVGHHRHRGSCGARRRAAGHPNSCAGQRDRPNVAVRRRVDGVSAHRRKQWRNLDGGGHRLDATDHRGRADSRCSDT